MDGQSQIHRKRIHRSKKRETWFDTFDVGYPASRGHTITEE